LKIGHLWDPGKCDVTKKGQLLTESE